MSAEQIPAELIRVGPFHLGDVLRNGLRELGATEHFSGEVTDTWLDRLSSHLDGVTPDPYAEPDAMVYLPARAFAALSNALALMVRHAIDDRETLGELAESRSRDSERLELLSHELAEHSSGIGALERHTAAQAFEAKLFAARLDDLEAKLPKPRTRKAA